MSIDNEVTFVETLYSSQVTLVRRGFDQSNRSVIVKNTAQEIPAERLIQQYSASLLAQNKVSHPAVNRILEKRENGAGCALILEDIGGVTLRSWIKSTLTEHAFWPLENPSLFHDWVLRLLRWSITLAEGISAFHHQDIIHNDINPANIVVNPDTNLLQIIDFGAAFPDGATINEWTVVEQHRTLTYISPEQTGRLNRNIDYRSDYYALGATLYQLFSSRPPFVAQDLPELIHCHIARSPIPLHQINPLIPSSLSALVSKLMAKAPEERYQNGRCLINDLKAIEQAVVNGIPFPSSELGENDVPEQLLIPAKLYGREKELEMLHLALSDRQNQAALITVEGEAGGGKTVLVNEAILHFVDHPFILLSGKGETYNKNPHSALSQALTKSVELLLALPNRQLVTWRTALLDELNNNPHTLIGLCPELVSVFDSVDVADKVPLHNADIQLKLHVAIFLRHLSQIDPVLLFIDDVQWCDTPSFGLFTALIEANHPRLTLIFTCRSEEIDEFHPYSQLKRGFKENHVPLTVIAINNLNFTQIKGLLSATFHNAGENLDALAKILSEKTLGNPLFILEFLKVASQRSNQTLFYDNRTGEWRWDKVKLQQIATSGNVAKLLIDSLHQQNKETQNLLQWAACIGTRFNENLLSAVTKMSPDLIKEYLNPAYKQGYIHRVADLQSDYIFNHDRIRQAYYELQSDKQVPKRHWSIGVTCFQGRGQYTNDPLPHLLTAMNDKRYPVVPEQKDIDWLIMAFFEGAQLAKEKTVYDIALEYINCAVRLLGCCRKIDCTINDCTNDDCVENVDHAIESSDIGEIFLLQGALAYLTRDTFLAEKAFDFYREINADPVLKASSYAQQTPLVFVSGDFEATVTFSLECLKLLGIDVPDIGHDISLHIRRQWDRFNASDGFEKISRISAPKIEDSVALSTLQSTTANMMLLGLSRSKFQWAEWFGLVGLNSFLSSGFTRFTPQLMGVFDSMLYSTGQSNFDNIIANKAYEFVESDISLSGIGFVYNTLGAYGGRYNLPISQCIRSLDLGAEYSLDKGEYLPYFACISNKIITEFSAGVSLPQLQKDTDTLKQFLFSSGGFVSAGKHYYRLIDQLTNLDVPNYLDRQQFTDGEWDALKNSVAYGAYFHLRLQRSFWRAEYELVINEYNEQRGLLDTLRGFSIGDDDHFLYVIAKCQDVSVDDYSVNKMLAEVDKSIHYIDNVSGIYPPNFLHKKLLIQAELCRLKRKENATDHYQKAAVDAKENGFIQMYSLAHELHGLYWLEQERPDYGKLHIVKALQGYQRWGCTLKLEQLSRRFDYLLAQGPPQLGWTRPAKVVGVQFQRSLLKISNEIAEELDFKQRLKQIVLLTVEHTGAERVELLLMRDDQYVSKVFADTVCVAGNCRVEAYESDSAAKGERDAKRTNELPMALIAQCAESKRPLLINDVASDPKYQGMAFFNATSVRSMLCYPVVYKGHCQSLLVLTHANRIDAFSRLDLQFLNTLAPQFAVSMENAWLYLERQDFNTVLEQKVEQRTQELQAANDELQAFTASVSHDLKAPLRAICGFTGALIEDCEEYLGEEGRNYVKLLSEASGVMEQVIDGLLTLSRSTQSTLAWEEVNLSTLVEDKLRWLRIMEPEHQVSGHIQQGLTTTGDLRLIRQVIDNLVTNAWKFSHDVAEPSIDFGMTITDRSSHTFYIRDNGVGFDAVNAGELFMPFRRFHRTDEFLGVGIGLAAVYRIVKRHGGEAWVESEVNQGATCYFTVGDKFT